MLLALAAPVMYACGGDDPEPTPTPEPEVTTLTVAPTDYEAPVEGGSFSIEVTAPTRPTVVADQKWVTVTDGTYSKYKITYPVAVAANESYDARTAVLTVRSGSLSQTVTVSQPAKEKPVDPDTPDEPSRGDNDAWKMAEKLGLGLNIGNQLDAFDSKTETAIEGYWTDGQKLAKEVFASLKSKGFKTVRIPVTWLGHIGEAPDYKLDDRLDRVAELVDYAEQAGLNVIVNMHHDGSIDHNGGTSYTTHWLNIRGAVASDAVNTQIKAEIKAVWTQIAERFKDKGDFLILESFNEIQDGHWGWSAEYQTAEGKKKQNDILNQWNQTFVDAVRATGGNNATRWLGVPGYAASPDFTLNDGFKVPEDKAGRIMVGVHYYSPYEFCQTAKYNDWGHTRKSNLGDSSYSEEAMKEIFSKLYNTFIAKNIPAYFGEFGCANRTDSKARAFQLYWFEYFCKCARTYGMPGFIWENGAVGAGNEIYGIIDHSTGEYLDATYCGQIVDACKKGFYTEGNSYTLQTVYDSAPKY